MDPILPADSSAACTSKHHLSCEGSTSSDSCQLKRQRTDDISSGLKERNSQFFERFDVVTNFSDHRFATSTLKQMSNAWVKKIQQEWKILQNDLPEAIFVRVYEGRMDLLRAVIIGSAGTPYHDGLFFFDFQFTSNYPNEPPKAYYRSGGLRLNPNLYADGTVCLSLLNTWYGRGCEKWDPKRSTMLQILISIQGLILNAKPYFNEPGTSWTSSTRWAKRSSLAYNEAAFLLSCRTMRYSLQNPPKHFEEFVLGHFRNNGLSILMACRAYFNGTLVGLASGGNMQPVIKGTNGNSKDFKAKVHKLIDELLNLFTAKGVDCKEFLTQNDNGSESSQLALQKSDGKNGTGADGKELNSEKAKPGDSSARPKQAKASKLKRLGQYLLKLGKKVLPIDN